MPLKLLRIRSRVHTKTHSIDQWRRRQDTRCQTSSIKYPSDISREKSPVINTMGDILNDIFPETSKALLSALHESSIAPVSLAVHVSQFGNAKQRLSDAINKSQTGGLTTHGNVFGVNIYNPNEGHYESFINPFTIGDAASRIFHHPENTDSLEAIMARLIVDTASHEVTHNMIRDEDRDLSRAFTFMKSRESGAINEAFHRAEKHYTKENMTLRISWITYKISSTIRLNNYDNTTEVKVFDAGKDRDEWDQPSPLSAKAGDTTGGGDPFNQAGRTGAEDSQGSLGK